jgi:hypothetical protein
VKVEQHLTTQPRRDTFNNIISLNKSTKEMKKKRERERVMSEKHRLHHFGCPS